MFEEYFRNVSVNEARASYWARQNTVLLNRAAEKLDAWGANPLAFTANYAHFEQLCTEADKDAVWELTDEEYYALCGEDW